MKWFQENRELGILLIVFGICVLFAGILLYWTGAKWSDARQAFDRAAAERTRLVSLDPFPNEANYRKLNLQVETYGVALDKFKEELKKETAPVPPLAPNEFQSRLRQVVIATLTRARVNNVKLPDKFQLGFDEFVTTMPKTAAAPLLGQELSQIQMLINILLDSRVDSVTSLHRGALPEESEISPAPAPKPTPAPRRQRPTAGGQKSQTTTEPGTAGPPLIQRNVVDLAFKAAPAAARRVLNEVARSNSQIFIIRTLYVHNENDEGPPREKTAKPTAAQPGGETPNEQTGAPGALTFIVGNEHVEISATIEMLRFNF